MVSLDEKIKGDEKALLALNFADSPGEQPAGLSDSDLIGTSLAQEADLESLERSGATTRRIAAAPMVLREENHLTPNLHREVNQSRYGDKWDVLGGSTPE